MCVSCALKFFNRDYTLMKTQNISDFLIAFLLILFCHILNYLILNVTRTNFIYI